ncbi:MAG: hypothetical protein ABI321_22790 [Polyangia bacterium]
MDELLIGLVVGIVKLNVWLVRGVYRILRGIVRAVATRLGGVTPQRREIAVARMKRAAPALPARAKAVDYRPRVVQHLDLSRALRELCDTQRNTRRFAPTLDGVIARAEKLASKLRIDSNMTVEQRLRLDGDESLRAIVRDLVEERRGSLAGLLDDTDALANASYAPIVEYCKQRDIALTSDRAATAIDGDKLFFMSIDDPAGLATIVLPSSFSTEISTWPAIAHEIAHDFFRSVGGLPQQLRAQLALGTNVALLGPEDGKASVGTIAERAVAAWMEELFADAFGTMMLGPAYLHTMMRSFASPDEPERALAMAYEGEKKRPVYEAHPPGHVRVVAGCRLLGRMGYGKEADALEATWRKLHGNPTSVYSALADGRWVRVPEDVVLDRAAEVGTSLYMQGLDCLRGQPLRSVAGLDFGPREHEQARRIGDRLAAGRPIDVKDPRLLVAGAVLGTVAMPKRAASIYALARNAIEGVDEPEAELALRDDVAGFEVGPAAAREAFLAGVLLGPPVSRR